MYDNKREDGLLTMIRYVHGSEDSLDLDVFYVFDKMPSFRDAKEFCASKIENRNAIVVKDGVVTDCYKGTVDEINNGLMVTYFLHKQEYPLIITKKLERDVLIKYIRVMRCLLSHCSRTIYRQNVKDALKSGSWSKRINTLKSINFDEIDDYGKGENKENIYKVFAFQLGQVLALHQGVELYTKSSVADFFPDLREYLYRMPNTSFNKLKLYLEQFIHLSSELNISEENNICFFIDFDKKVNLINESYIN